MAGKTFTDVRSHKVWTADGIIGHHLVKYEWNWCPALIAPVLQCGHVLDVMVGYQTVGETG